MIASIVTSIGGRVEVDDDKQRGPGKRDWNVSVKILDRKGDVTSQTLVKHSDLKLLLKSL